MLVIALSLAPVAKADERLLTLTDCPLKLAFSASAPPAQLLEQLAIQADFDLHSVPQPDVTVSVNRTGSVEEILEAILGHRNWAARHAAAGDCDTPRLAEIWILGPGKREPLAVADASEQSPVTETDIELAPEHSPAARDGGDQPAKGMANLATPSQRGRMSAAERIEERTRRKSERAHAAPASQQPGQAQP